MGAMSKRRYSPRLASDSLAVSDTMSRAVYWALINVRSPTRPLESILTRGLLETEPGSGTSSGFASRLISYSSLTSVLYIFHAGLGSLHLVFYEQHFVAP